MLAPPAVAPPHPVCLRRLPAGIARLPARVALDAGCGLVVLGPGARVVLRPRPRPTYGPGAQAAPGVGVTFRGRHVVMVRGGRVVWRSRWTFLAGERAGRFTTISAADWSAGRLAYAVSRWSGRPRRERRLVFVVRRGGAERRVETDGFPVGWTARGLLTIARARGA